MSLALGKFMHHISHIRCPPQMLTTDGATADTVGRDMQFALIVSSRVFISIDLCRMIQLACSFLSICVECHSSRGHYCCR